MLPMMPTLIRYVHYIVSEYLTMQRLERYGWMDGGHCLGDSARSRVYSLSSLCCCCGVVRFAGWAAVTNALLSPLTRPHTAPSDGRLEGNPSVGRFWEPLF